MFTFRIEDPDEGLSEVIRALKVNGITSASRNGPVVRFPRPVCLEYVTPQRRLVTSAVRDANPFFHLFETMWMFGGLANIKPLLTYNPGMAQYSDDGQNLRGTAYGHRWRSYAWGDQLKKARAALVFNPEDRRVVVTMWDPLELGEEGKDFACNLQVLFSTRPPAAEGERYTLDMTVTNRSNDLIYGAMGSNLFHFSMLLEYMALHCNMEVGSYYQVANNLHLYTENSAAAKCWDGADSIANEVPEAVEKDQRLTQLALTFDPAPIAEYVMNRDAEVTDPYLMGVVAPLVEAYHVFKMKSKYKVALETNQRVGLAMGLASGCQSLPLRAACIAWLKRRMQPVAATPPGSQVLTGVVTVGGGWAVQPHNPALQSVGGAQ